MKKILLLSLILTSWYSSFAQYEFTETDKLAITARIWGFLKYYHPEVADGKYNWDEELFDILPKVKYSKNKEQLSLIYLEWINKLGEIKQFNKCSKHTAEYFNKNFDLSWINSRNLFTQKLSEKLWYIEQNRHQGKKYYVSVANKKVGNITITNETEYAPDWENENLRLLTLFRYWNIIEYFFPYKYQTNKDWDQVLKDMIPKFLYPQDETNFHLTMLELIVSIDDSHGYFMTRNTYNYFGNYWFPAKFQLIDENAIITGFFGNDSLARANDLRVGDVITRVNNRAIADIYKENETFIVGSNQSRKKLNATNSILNGLSDSVEIEFIRNNLTYSKAIKRYPFHNLKYHWKKEAKKYKLLDENIGYINMGEINIEDVSKIMDSLKNTKAIVFDIRNYPKGTLYSIAKYITSQKSDFYKVIYPDLDYPGRFIWRDGSQCGGNGELKYKGKVILLINERTQSHAEFTTMCLQTGDNVTTLGSQTSGADGNVSHFNMVGGYKTGMTGIGIFYPDKTETQRKGVKIDIEVKPTIQGIIDQKDEVLIKAIEILNDSE